MGLVRRNYNLSDFIRVNKRGQADGGGISYNLEDNRRESRGEQRERREE